MNSVIASTKTPRRSERLANRLTIQYNTNTPRRSERLANRLTVQGNTETPRHFERLPNKQTVQYNTENPRRSERLANKSATHYTSHTKFETLKRTSTIQSNKKEEIDCDSDDEGYNSDATEYCLVYNAIYKRNRTASKKVIHRLVVRAFKEDNWMDMAYST